VNAGAPLIVAEPPASLARRPRLVVDASVVAAAVFAESSLAEALAWMRGRLLVAPALIDCEIANAALGKVRRQKLPIAAAAAALEVFAGLELERHGIDATRVFALAARYELTAYDAAYLWLAERLEAPLATFDDRLGRAARAHFGGDGPR
jgi:predicted nucleic acid-binding protein